MRWAIFLLLLLVIRGRVEGGRVDLRLVDYPLGGLMGQPQYDVQ